MRMWLEHAVRMHQTLAKKIFESKADVQKKVGRLRLRWLGNAESDLHILKVKRHT
jgi:hypothetical protein